MSEIVALSKILPQARPMILLSGYEPPETDEQRVTAYVDVGPDAPFYDVLEEGVPGCVALEYMAQTMALLVGLVRRKKGLGPQLGFVLGSRNLEIRIGYFKKGRRYLIDAVNTYQDEEFGSFDCTIRTAEGEIVARGTVTAFQPSGDVTVETLKGLS